MKLFGFTLWEKSKVELVQDQIPEVKVVIPDTKRPALIKRVPNPSLSYHVSRDQGRGSFMPSEYDLAEVGRIEDTDSYVRQSFDKKVALMFKEGWDIVGPNRRVIKYIKTRFAQIAKASGIPTKQLLREVGSGMIRKSNTFIIKARKTEASGGAVRRVPGERKLLKPVAAYFIAPAETMEYESSGNKITKWRQRMPDGEIKEYSPKDVIHFYFDRKEGFVFGTPSIVPVVDDIRALRKIEENIELLIYQHLFPLFQYIVGTPEAPAGMTEAGEYEIDVIKREIQYMPTEGGIVLPERHRIEAIGAEGRALRAEGYLEHFKKRVFAGLGISAVDVGEGETANRACYSEDTETLTDSGWKFYWQITSEDKIATLNPETERLEFHRPNGDILLYHYEGNMIHFNNHNVDVLVTPDHDVFMGRPRNSDTLTWEKIKAEEIDIHQFKFYSGGMDWTGIEPEDFLLPYIPDNCYSEIPNPSPWKRIDIKDWLRFIGLYVSEGTLAKSKDKWTVSISQDNQINPEKIKYIRQILNRLPFKHNEYTDPGDQTTRFEINCKSLYLYLESECSDYSYLKHIPHDMLGYDKEYLYVLFEALMIGDDAFNEREGRISKTYYSKSEKLIDQIQELSLKLGFCAHVLDDSKCKRVCISENTISDVTLDQVEKVFYSGKVYCYNVPNHLFFTRRHGRVGVHGNTADNMSRNLIDSVKDFQQLMEIIVNEHIIGELLLESTFGPEVLDEDNRCFLKFKEIDIEQQIKREAHIVDQFNKHAVTWPEVRERMGLEPILVPSIDEVQAGTDTPDKYPEWNNTWWKLFRLPELLIQALDEPWSPAAKAAARDNSLPMTEGDNISAAQEKQEQEIAIEKAKAVSKLKPKPQKDNYLASTFTQTKKDILAWVSFNESIDQDWVSSLIRTQLNTAVNRLVADQMLSFYRGFSSQAPPTSAEYITKASFSRRIFQERADKYVSRLTEDIVKTLKRHTSQITEPAELVNKTRAVFDSLKFRTDFIEDVEIRRAHSLGLIYGGLATGKEVGRSIAAGVDPCERCLRHSGQEFSLADATIEDIPPYHASCTCGLDMSTIEVGFQDEDIDSPKGYMQESDYSKCPECGSTAIRKKDTPDIFNCRKCGHSFRTVEDKDEPIEDQEKFERCVMHLKQSLRKSHPDWDEKKIKSVAIATCTKQSKGK